MTLDRQCFAPVLRIPPACSGTAQILVELKLSQENRMNENQKKIFSFPFSWKFFVHEWTFLCADCWVENSTFRHFQKLNMFDVYPRLMLIVVSGGGSSNRSSKSDDSQELMPSSTMFFSSDFHFLFPPTQTRKLKWRWGKHEWKNRSMCAGFLRGDKFFYMTWVSLVESKSWMKAHVVASESVRTCGSLLCNRLLSMNMNMKTSRIDSTFTVPQLFTTNKNNK